MAGEMPDLSGILNGLLSNPSAAAGLLRLLSSQGGGHADAFDHGAGKNPPEEAEASPGGTAPLASKPCSSHPSKRSRWDERRALLRALRPFLRQDRQPALDTVIRILDIIELFDKKGGF